MLVVQMVLSGCLIPKMTCLSYKKDLSICLTKRNYLLVLPKGPFYMSYQKDLSICHIKRTFLSVIPKGPLYLSQSRYIDDLISLNNPTFHTFILAIFPKELQIKQENTTQDSASYLELQYTIQDEEFHTRLYDKCDSFNFNVVNYPFVEQSNIPETPAYGVYTSHLVCIARVCDSYKDFKLRHNNLCLKLYHQGFKYNKLYKYWKKTLWSHKVLFAKQDVMMYDQKFLYQC